MMIEAKVSVNKKLSRRAVECVFWLFDIVKDCEVSFIGLTDSTRAEWNVSLWVKEGYHEKEISDHMDNVISFDGSCWSSKGDKFTEYVSVSYPQLLEEDDWYERPFAGYL